MWAPEALLSYLSTIIHLIYLKFESKMTYKWETKQTETSLKRDIKF